MKLKNFFAAVLIAGIMLCAFAAPLTFAQEEQKATVIIPPQVKTVFQEGMVSREARLDIPFQITQSLFLPAGQSVPAGLSFTLAFLSTDLQRLETSFPGSALQQADCRQIHWR